MLLLLLQAVHSSGQHSISFTLSRNQTVVVEYCHDNNTDMFQVTPQRGDDITQSFTYE